MGRSVAPEPFPHTTPHPLLLKDHSLHQVPNRPQVVRPHHDRCTDKRWLARHPPCHFCRLLYDSHYARPSPQTGSWRNHPKPVSTLWTRTGIIREVRMHTSPRSRRSIPRDRRDEAGGHEHILRKKLHRAVQLLAGMCSPPRCGFSDVYTILAEGLRRNSPTLQPISGWLLFEILAGTE